MTDGAWLTRLTEGLVDWPIGDLAFFAAISGLELVLEFFGACIEQDVNTLSVPVKEVMHTTTENGSCVSYDDATGSCTFVTIRSLQPLLLRLFTPN
jgi:hypothetical protein